MSTPKYILVLKGTKHDNIKAVERALISIFRDLDDEDPWQAAAADTWPLATALCTGNAQFTFDANSIRFGTMRLLNDARVIHVFKEES